MLNNVVTKETWRDVTGYEGYYKVSDKGRVLSLIGWNGHRYVKQKRIIKGWVQKTEVGGDYKRNVVTLNGNGEKKEMKVHRLVAMAFIPNPEKRLEVNHIDGNPLNNNVNNLEWATRSENTKHAWATGLRGSVIHDRENEMINDYKNGLTARELSKKYSSNWKTMKEILVENGIRIITPSERKTVYQIDKKELVKDFDEGMRNVDIAKKYNTNTALIGTYKYKHKRGELI